VDACTDAQGELLHISSAAEQQLMEQVCASFGSKVCARMLPRCLLLHAPACCAS
jgi:hypothetical protein